MPRTKKKKPGIDDAYLKKQREQEAENRRKFLAKLDPKAREYAVRCFAQLGLHQ